jgi:PAS domain S-box-containing protein
VGTATHRYLAGWIAVALAGTVAVLALAGWERPDLASVALFVVAVAIAERVELYFHFERADAGFTLIEVAITAGLLLLAPAHVVLGAAAGMALAQVSLLASPTKFGFNIAQTAAATSAAALVLTVTPSIGPLVAGRPVLGAIGGMTVYVVVNVAAVAGLMHRVAGREAAQALRAQIPVTAGTILGTTAVGVVVASLWTTQPALVPFLLAPAAAIHLAARATIRAANLLERTRSEHQRLERIVDGASDGILLLDGSGTVQVWNPAMERMTGLPAELTVGRRVHRVLTEQVRIADEPVDEGWLAARAHGERGAPVHDAEAELRHVDGTQRAVRESHALVFDDRGRCTGDVVVVRDVSRQQELERLRSDFVARVSHELRTPLTPIRGFASVLLRRGPDLNEEQRKEALERIVERADHLGEVVEDLLLVTRLDRRELDELVHPHPSDLRPLVEEAVAALRASSPERTVTCSVTPGTGEALADPERTRQIIDALLDNADRYTPADTPIEVELDQDGDDIRVRVIDHGPGIPRQHHETVFEQFQRLENPLTMRTGGVGLGLFLGRRLAEAMHGALELEPPRHGAGTVAVLRLPTAQPAEHEAQHRPFGDAS